MIVNHTCSCQLHFEETSRGTARDWLSFLIFRHSNLQWLDLETRSQPVQTCLYLGINFHKYKVEFPFVSLKMLAFKLEGTSGLCSFW